MATAATAATPATRSKKPLPAPNSDFYEVYETLNAGSRGEEHERSLAIRLKRRR